MMVVVLGDRGWHRRPRLPAVLFLLGKGRRLA